MMLVKEQEISISRFLSLVLRHKPETIGIKLDANGWTDVDVLLEKASEHGVKINRTILVHIVDTNSKKRFAFNADGNKIRANQGHSVSIDLGYTTKQPPEILYHGTSKDTVVAILETGIKKGARQHVHLSADIETAIKVGQRHGKPAVFEVMAGKMCVDEFEFFLSANGVWLTDNVPVKYLKLND